MKVSEDVELCPIARALECVGDSWTLLILRDALQGATRFDQFQRDLGIASNMLTRRLDRMVASGLFEKSRYQTRPPRFEYRLTEKAYDLTPVILTLYQWGERHLPIEACGQRLVHRLTQEPIEPVLYDGRQGGPLTLGNVRLVPGPDATPAIRLRAERMQAAFENACAFSASPDDTPADSEPACGDWHPIND